MPDGVRKVARHHVADAEAAADAIAAEDSFLPARAWLVQDDGQAGDPEAVSIYFPTARGACRAAVLSRQTGRLYRLQMNAIGRAGETVEVLACVVGYARDKVLSVHVYLPEEFDQFVAAGYDQVPANRPAWLADTSTVAPRAVVSDDGSEFSPDELRKVYCRFLKSRRCRSLPDNIERAIQSRNTGPSVIRADDAGAHEGATTRCAGDMLAGLLGRVVTWRCLHDS